MSKRIWSIKDLRREQRKAGEAGTSFYPEVARGSPAAGRLLHELYKTVECSPPENIHDAPVNVAALMGLIRQWEAADQQFQDRTAQLAVELTVAKSPRRRSASSATLRRKRLGLTWLANRAAGHRYEKMAVVLTAAGEPSEVANSLRLLAAETGRVYQALLSREDPDQRRPPAAYWTGVLVSFLRDRDWVTKHTDCLLIDRPFAAAAAMLRRSLFGHWSGPQGAVREVDAPSPKLAESSMPIPSRGGKGKNIDGKMLKLLLEDPDSFEWSARKWARKLKCTHSTVLGTATWKHCLKLRANAGLKLKEWQMEEEGRADNH